MKNNIVGDYQLGIGWNLPLWVWENAGNSKILCQTQFKKFMNQESKIYRGENASLLCCWFDLASTSSLGDPSFLTKLLFNGHWGAGPRERGYYLPQGQSHFPHCAAPSSYQISCVFHYFTRWSYQGSFQEHNMTSGSRIECVRTMFCWCLSVTHETSAVPASCRRYIAHVI